MIKYLFAFFILALLFSAQSGHAEEHRHHGAHVHGGGQLSIAFDGLKGRIEFTAAAEGILGFEHDARTKDEKAKLAEAIQLFEQTPQKLFSFEADRTCVMKADKVAMESEKAESEHKNEKHGQHANFVANYNIECAKSVKESDLKMDLTMFKRIKDVDITILIDNDQKSLEYKAKILTIKL